jgi:hypothetical protein
MSETLVAEMLVPVEILQDSRLNESAVFPVPSA